MKYSFRFSELKYINKVVFKNQLYGIQNNRFPCLKTKRNMIQSGIFKESKNIELSSLYCQLFSDWSKMQYAITFPNQGRHGLESCTLLCNSRNIVTVENNVSCVDIGYYFYEYVGYRNYILHKLDLRFELKVDKEIDFCCTLTKDEFEKFMSYDTEFFNDLSQRTGVDTVIIGGLVTELYNPECKKVLTKDIESGVQSEFLIYSNIAANFWCKKILRADNKLSYVVGITNTPSLLREIQKFK